MLQLMAIGVIGDCQEHVQLHVVLVQQPVQEVASHLKMGALQYVLELDQAQTPQSVMKGLAQVSKRLN